MTINKSKIRRSIKQKTIIPIAVLIIIIIALAIGSILSESKKVDVIFEMVIPFAVVIIMLALAHGYAWHMALVEEEDTAGYFLEKYKIGFLTAGLMAGIAFLVSYIGINRNMGDSITIIYNVVIFFIAVAQVLLAGFCIGACSNALESKSDKKMSKYYIIKAEKCKYIYTFTCFIMIVFTYIFI